MKRSGVRIFAVVILVLWMTAVPLYAQNEQGRSEQTTEEETTETDTGKVLSPYNASRPAKGAHWFNFIWRSGFGIYGQGINLNFRNIKGHEEFTASGGGFADIHTPSFWFYPTPSRNFMISVGFAGGSAQGTLVGEDDYDKFLDEKEYWMSYAWVPVGFGYRWLAGSRDQVSLNLFGELGWYNAGLRIEGASDTLSLNGSGIGAVFSAHYRYDNGFLLGGSFEMRAVGGHQNSTGLAGRLVDVDTGGSFLLFGIVLGYEPREVSGNGREM